LGARIVAGMRLDPRPNASLGRVNTEAELAYLRAGSDPSWERPHDDGADITAQPERWTPSQWERRLAFEERVQQYRRDGLI
jgi:hypothetical protein